MLSAQANKVREDISVIQVCVHLNSEFRRLRNAASSHSTSSSPCLFEALPCPDRADWAVYDHCAAVTRLYAVYERFVEDVVASWLRITPALFSDYSQLPESVRSNHIAGLCRVLPKVGKGRYKHLTPEAVTQGLFRGAKGIGGYDLPFELFAITERNLRLSALEELLARVGISDLRGWLARHGELQEFMAASYAGQETVDSKLNSLVSYRNEAGHGEEISQVLGTSDFLQLANFVTHLCAAIGELFYNCYCECRLANNSAKLAGVVTEEFKAAQAVVAVLENCEISTGMEIGVVSNSGCGLATVNSIQLNDVDVMQAVISSKMEVGLKLSVRCREGGRIVIFAPDGDSFIRANI